MTDAVRHPTPSMRAVLTEQVRFAGLVVRRDAAIVAVLLAAMLLIPWHDQPINFTREFGPWFATLGFVTPLLMWKRLRRSGHFWMLPVEHRRHALATVVAGWCWLMIAATLLLLWAAALVLRTDGSFVVEQARTVLSGSMLPAGVLEPGQLATVQWRTPRWLWVLPFTSATVAYLLGSAVALSAGRVQRWLGAIAAVLLLVVLLGENGGFEGLSNAVATVASHRYGLETVFAGSPMTHDTAEVILSNQERVFVWLSLPTRERWVVATALWLVTGFVALWLATIRYREREGGGDRVARATLP